MVSTHLAPQDRFMFRHMSRWFGVIILFTYMVITMGAMVRATDSGLACPDWPLCHGEVIPPFNAQVFFEWFHRLIAGTLMISIFTALIKVLRNKTMRKVLAAPLFAAVILVLVQAVLGGLTVLHLLEPKIVSLHLITGTAFFGILIWMRFKTLSLGSETYGHALVRIPPRTKKLFLLLTVLIYSQITVGGMVSTNYAGLACLDFPTCHGAWGIIGTFADKVQMSHRYFGFLILCYSLFMLWKIGSRNLYGLPQFALWSLPCLIGFQILLGVVNIFFMLPDWASVAHLANAELIFGLSLASTLELSQWQEDSLVFEQNSILNPKESKAF